jgi:hypothetical protein
VCRVFSMVTNGVFAGTVRAGPPACAGRADCSRLSGPGPGTLPAPVRPRGGTVPGPGGRKGDPIRTITLIDLAGLICLAGPAEDLRSARSLT